MNNKVDVTVITVTVELEKHDHDVVDQGEQKKSGLITHNLFKCENISAVFTSETCHGLASKAFAFHQLNGFPLELFHVNKLEEGEGEADHYENVV